MENHKYHVSKTICERKNSDLIIPYPDEDIIYDMLMMLCARKLQRMRYTCKQWIEVINSSRFINAHLRKSIPGFLAISRSALCYDSLYRYSDLENIQIENGKNVSVSRFKLKCKKIVKSSCNGLLLLDDMPSVGRLIVANPITNQFVELPPCTQWPKYTDIYIIRGITFIGSTGEYKVASLVYNDTGSLSCEMLTLGSTFGKWKWVHSPFKRLFNWYVQTYGSVIIKGVIHLAGCEADNGMVGSRTITSFDTAREKFYKSDMPAVGRLISLEVLHEIEGCPSIVVPNMEEQNHELCQWDIWVLKDLNIGEWHKLYSVNLIAYGCRYPQNWQYSDVLATLENGRFFIIGGFENHNKVYFFYDVQLQQMTSIKLGARIMSAFIPYVESLTPCPN